MRHDCAISILIESGRTVIIRIVCIAVYVYTIPAVINRRQIKNGPISFIYVAI